MIEPLFRRVAGELRKEELPVGMAVLALPTELLLIELTVLEADGSGLARNDSHPLLATLVLKLSLYLLMGTLLGVVIALRNLGKRVTVVRPLALACLYRGVMEVAAGVLVGGTLAIVLGSFALLVALLQNIDNTFCSKDSTPQTNQLNAPLLTIVEIFIVVVRGCLPNSGVAMGVCSAVVLAMLIKRILQPYLLWYVQVLETSMLGLVGVHTLLLAVIGLQKQSLINNQFIQQNLTQITALIVLPTLLGLTIRFPVRMLRSDMPQINSEVLHDNLVKVLRQFNKSHISEELKAYCTRVNRYVQFERVSDWQPLAQPISIANKKQWALFIYRVSSDDRHFRQMTELLSKDHPSTVACQHSADSFELLLNCFYFQYYFTRNWTKCIRLLEDLNRKQERRWYLPSMPIQRLLVLHAEATLSGGLDKLGKLESFREFDLVNSLLMDLMATAVNYREFWKYLQAKYIHVDQAIERADRLLRETEHINAKAAQLDFRSLYLQQCLVGFDLMVRLDPTSSALRNNRHNKNLQMMKVDPDIGGYIFLEVSLERSNMGKVVSTGLNSGKLVQPKGISRKNMNASHFIPECLHNYHQQQLQKFIYGEHSIDSLTPFNKTTFCVNNTYLQRIQVRTKLSFVDQHLTAIGYMKMLSQPGEMLLLCEKSTGKILEVSEQMHKVLRRMEEKFEMPCEHLTAAFGINQFEQGVNVSLDHRNSQQPCTFEMRQLSAVRKGLEDEDSEVLLLGLIPLKEKAVSRVGTLKRTSNRKVPSEIVSALSPVLSPELIEMSSNSTLPVFFKQQEQLKNLHGRNHYTKLFAAAVSCSLLVLLFKGCGCALQGANMAAMQNHTDIVRYISVRKLLSNRMLLQANYLHLQQADTYQLASIDIQQQLTQITSDLYWAVTNLSQIGGPRPNITVYYSPIDTGIQMNARLILLESISKCQLMLAAAENDTNDRITLLQVRSAEDFLMLNYGGIVSASNTSVFLSAYKQTKDTVVALCWVGRLMTLMVLVATGGVIALVVVLERKVEGLKKEACQAIFQIGEPDIGWIVSRGQCYLNGMQSRNDNEEVSEEEEQTDRPAWLRPTNDQSMTDSGLTSQRMHLYPPHPRASQRPTRRNATIQKNIQIDPSIKASDTERVFNNPRKMAIGLLLLYLLVAASVFTCQILSLSSTATLADKSQRMVTDYGILTQCQFQLTLLYTSYFKALITGRFDPSELSNAASSYLSSRKELINFGEGYSAQFSQALNLLFYANISTYFTNPAINLQMSVDSLMAMQFSAIMDSASSNKTAQTEQTVNWLASGSDVVDELYTQLAAKYMRSHTNRQKSAFQTMRVWSVAVLGCITMLIIIVQAHIVSVALRRGRLQAVLSLLKRENFTDKSMKESICPSYRPKKNSCSESVGLMLGRQLLESERSLG